MRPRRIDVSAIIPRAATARGIRDARRYPNALCLRTIDDIEQDIF